MGDALDDMDMMETGSEQGSRGEGEGKDKDNEIEVIDDDDDDDDDDDGNDDDAGKVSEISAKKERWGRPETDDLSTSPSVDADDQKTIDGWKQSLKEDKRLWPSGWHVVDTPAKSEGGWFIDKYGVYLLKGGACIDESTKLDYGWHCLATACCRRKLITVSNTWT